MLSHDVSRYIALNHAIGLKFKVQTYLLRSFAAFAEQRGEGRVHTQTVLDWAALGPSARTRRGRLLTIRRFAETMQAEDERHEIPPADAFGCRPHRYMPHIFTNEQVRNLIRAARKLKPRRSFRPIMYSTLFALLATTGLRISEALYLQIADVTADGLLIRATKFRKSRLVPLHDTAQQAINHYLAARARINPVASEVFVSRQGIRLPYTTVHAVFRKLLRSVGLLNEPGRGGPRIHDLRHAFAIHALERFAGNRQGVSQHTLALSTYLGHVGVSSTYWYLQATPKLLQDIATATENLHEGGCR
jgi:integrase